MYTSLDRQGAANFDVDHPYQGGHAAAIMGDISYQIGYGVE